jgi:hypothetical protein
VQTSVQFNSRSTEATLTHSKMLHTRRKKQKAKKVLAKLGKRAKKLGKQDRPGVAAANPQQ